MEHLEEKLAKYSSPRNLINGTIMIGVRLMPILEVDPGSDTVEARVMVFSRYTVEGAAWHDTINHSDIDVLGLQIGTFWSPEIGN